LSVNTPPLRVNTPQRARRFQSSSYLLSIGSSQTRAVRSSLAVTTRVPSGLNATARTEPAIAATWRHDLLLLAHVAEQRTGQVYQRSRRGRWMHAASAAVPDAAKESDASLGSDFGERGECGADDSACGEAPTRCARCGRAGVVDGNR
jgi:hypothetical protein